MKLIDAHIHLSDPAYDGNINKIVEIAKQVGVIAMISNSMNLETSRLSLTLADEHPNLVYAAVGVHPWSVDQLASNELEQTVDFIAGKGTSKEKVVAIGEVGLDPQYAKRRAQKDRQTDVFQKMLGLAEKLSLPAIVHSRWSAQRILETLSSYRLKGVLWHWFSGPVELLPRIIERGDYISEGPPVVFSERIQEVVKAMPLERLFTETDGPVQYYGPFKDKQTTPAFIRDVIKAISQVKGVHESQVAEQILRNFACFFDVRL